MTSDELGKPVKAADEVDNAASKVGIDTEDLRRWAKIAGIELDLPAPPSSVEVAKPEPEVEAKPFPKLAPPPEDSSRPSSKRSSKFGFFGGKSQDGDEDEDSDDDMAGAGGYARLDGPASPETIEKELAPLEHKERKQVSEPEAEVQPKPASEDKIREILKDVLSKVNAMVRPSYMIGLITVKIPHCSTSLSQLPPHHPQDYTLESSYGRSERRDAGRTTQTAI
jgi:hypothetical protein